MNSAPQPRQPYYPNRPSLPSGAPRVPPNSTPRQVPPTHVYPTSSQVMMIPQQQLQFPNSQGPAYFLPAGQYRASYVPPTQPFSVAGAPTTAASPTPSACPTPAAQARTQAGEELKSFSLECLVRAGSHPPNHVPQIRIRDPNQGGRDVTEEIMSGARNSSTPTPPQVSSPKPGQNLQLARDVQSAPPTSAVTLGQDTDEDFGASASSPPDSSASPSPPPDMTAIPLAHSSASPEPKMGNNLDAPLLPLAVPQEEEEPIEPEAPVEQLCADVEKAEPEVVREQELEPLAEIAQPVSDPMPAPSTAAAMPNDDSPSPIANGGEVTSAEATPTTDPMAEPVPEPEVSVDQPENVPLHNGLPQDPEEKPEGSGEPELEVAEPIAEPEAPEVQQKAPAVVPSPLVLEADVKAEEAPVLASSCPVDESLQGKGVCGDPPLSPSPEHWKPINPEEKKRYDREFLLRFQFISASMHKPEGLPHITDVVLDKANKTPLRPLDPSRLMNCGPDFTPSFANLGRQPPGAGRGPPPGPRRSQQGQRKEPRKIIASVSLNDDIQLNKAEKAWKPSTKKGRGRVPETDEDDPEVAKTQELLRRVRSVLNKLTPQMFQPLMKQVMELTIDTEERLKGVIDLIFEKAISEPNFSVAYANMCRCLMGLKVRTSDKTGATVNFRKLLLNRCQKEFEKDKDDDEIFEHKQKELDAASEEEERQRLVEELEDAKDKARRRSLGNIKFIGELFKLKMLTEPIMHDCIVKLLKNHDEESLECLCRLLSTIGKDLDFEKAKPRMDQYFNQMEKIIKERKTSSRIRFMLQDVLDLRRNNWVPRRGDQGPKTIDQIHKEAELEEHREQIKVQQQLLSKKDSSQGRGGRSGAHSSGGRITQPQDEGWNTVPITTKTRPIDTSRLSKITKFSLFLCRSSSSKERNDRDRFERFDRRDSREDRERGLDRNRPVVTKRSFSRESDERARGGEGRGATDTVRRVASMTDERGSPKRETAPTPPPTPVKPALSEEELDKKSVAIIEEYLHINDLKEAVQCVQELNSPSLLFVFVRNGVESTLERSTIAREHMGQLLHRLISNSVLPTEQYHKGLREILEVADDMAIDIPHIWQYLAEIITPMLHEGGVHMGQLFREVSKPLLPIGKAAVLLVQILNLLCKGLKKVGALWSEAGLNWKDFLQEDEDVNKFVTEWKMEFTLGEESEKPSKKELTPEELSRILDRLIEDKASNQRIHDWVEANLDEQKIASNQFVRALMTSVCQSAIICENPYKVDVEQITQRAKLLQKYLLNEQKELQALYALQALMVRLEQPANLLRTFFDTLYDEDVIKEEAFYKWESSKDPTEQVGKGVALKSVTAFFTWLREAEEESDNN
uniref:Eukaryotic translation initiation factor 4 gamma, 1a n=1 Tax=Electrophorus electricus TaxID=8005 RepID=A0A4W4FZT4_ELEEL